MKKIFVVILLLGCIYNLKAQDKFKPEQIGLSYYGDMGIYSGFKLSANYLKWTKDKTRKRKGKVVKKSTYLNPTLTHWGIPKTLKNWQLGGEIERVRIHNKGRRFRTVQAGLHANLTFNSGTTYELIGDEIISYGSSSRFYLVPNIAFGTGRIIKIKNFNTMHIAAKVHGYTKSPYNFFGAAPGLALELQLKYTL